MFLFVNWPFGNLARLAAILPADCKPIVIYALTESIEVESELLPSDLEKVHTNLTFTHIFRSLTARAALIEFKVHL